MKVTSITVTRTIQIKQYEPLCIAATADIAAGQNAVGEAFELLELVREILFTASGAMRADLRPQQMALPLAWDDPRD